jgi:hypothetical protein
MQERKGESRAEGLQFEAWDMFRVKNASLGVFDVAMVEAQTRQV